MWWLVTRAVMRGLTKAIYSRRFERGWPLMESHDTSGPKSIFPERMLTEYISKAMHRARYELMENDRFSATIPDLKGLWAEAGTLEECREELQHTLEDWIVFKLRHRDSFVVLDGADLNPQPAYAEAD